MQHRFNEEQLLILRQNPYTLRVDERQIRFTVSFKKYLYETLNAGGVSVKEAFKNAGYNPEWLGVSRMSSIVFSVRREAHSAKGFRETIRHSSPSILEEELEKKRTKTAIKTLELHLAKLEQEVACLKKISEIEKM